MKSSDQPFKVHGHVSGNIMRYFLPLVRLTMRDSIGKLSLVYPGTCFFVHLDVMAVIYCQKNKKCEGGILFETDTFRE